MFYPGIVKHFNMKFFLAATLAIASAANLPAEPMSVLPLKDQVGVGRIVGGEEAADGEFPHQVSLRSIGALGSTHFCGASIIDKDWILTAAHCCANHGPLNMHVVAGGIKLNNFENEEENRNLEHVISHPNYDSSILINDICLLKLKESLEWTDFVQPIALPAGGQMTEAGTDCIVTGWGTLSEGAFGLPNVLNKVTVPVVSDEECNADYGSSGINVADSMICAGLKEGGKDSCQGDSGGPFVCGGELVGVVSWGVGCARKGYPGVYTENSYYVDWIAETMAAN